jgi:hypothetical protein
VGDQRDNFDAPEVPEAEQSAVEFTEERDSNVSQDELGNFSQAVLWASDWTAETVLSQLTRGNIEMNPRFQRRDAWTRSNKSKFIESLVLGLPIPQIVLAERRDRRGQYIVLDGKQRLLSLLHFSNHGEGRDVGFRLTSLEARSDLNRKRYIDFRDDPDLQDDFNALSSHVIRAVIIRNWPNFAFLHLVFLRLNTGSLKLSPQELRQAIVPGPFADFVDDAALASEQIQALLGRTTPDPRMRDVELLVRYFAFAHRLEFYTGRMKSFLDDSCVAFNLAWEGWNDVLQVSYLELLAGIDALQEIFEQQVARKQGSRLFNRSIFDALAHYAAQPLIRDAMLARPDRTRMAYLELIDNAEFQEAVESDTAGIPHTVARIRLWGEALTRYLGVETRLPRAHENTVLFDR